MEALKQAILQNGYGVGEDIVKVDMFLNHRLNTSLIMQMGEEFKKHFSPKKVDLVLTIETSGIPIAMATAIAFGNVPVLFAKKNPIQLLSHIVDKNECYYSSVYSFTHHNRNVITAKKEFLPQGSNVLIVDDFLANGEATHGLIDLVKQAKCELVGIGIAIEKGFQPGGKDLRSRGFDVKSLATITSLHDGVMTLA